VANPNSWLSRRRFALVRIIEPKPRDGEAWCIECGLNEYRALVMPVDDVQAHVRAHVDAANARVLRIMYAKALMEE
jgi:hypothetical protein